MNRPARRRSSKPQPSTADEHNSPNSTANPNNNNDNNNHSTSTTMDGAHRKIDLQSPEDLTYLITNVRRAAAEHISEAFPPVEGDDAGGDELRVRIEQMVDEYISQTFTLAAPNLCINGFDLDAKTFPAVYLASSPSKTTINNATAPEEALIQFEPFDARKRARVEELAREEEDLMREIATLKKTVPAATAKQYAERFWEGLQGDQTDFEAAAAEAASVVGGGDGGGATTTAITTTTPEETTGALVLLEGVGRVERREEVERGYKGVVDTLGRLKREMPATVARMERARVAGEYVVTER